MKKILSIGLAVGFLTLLAIKEPKADSIGFTLNGTSPTNVILTGPARITSISVQSDSITNGLINFYDSAFLSNSIIIGAYTNLTKAAATTNQVYTNVFGVLSTNVFTVIRYTTNTVAGTRYTRPLIASVTTVSNTVLTLDFSGTYVGQGLMVTNITTLGGTPGSVIINVEFQEFK